MRYVTHDSSGNLTGCYLQDVLPEHASVAVACTEDQAQVWTSLMWDGKNLVAKPPAPPVVVVPQVISPRQFRQSLTKYAFRTAVENAVNASDQDTKDWYAYATQFERSHPKVLAMAASLGYSSAQVDAVWTYGASI